ncbi:MAG: hypothetical protein IJQ21_12465, partial [Lachnospiraceae bacterium]|nr:hypothetical protein [Lachnospiraceae bacterium]
ESVKLPLGALFVLRFPFDAAVFFCGNIPSPCSSRFFTHKYKGNPLSFQLPADEMIFVAFRHNFIYAGK